MGVGSDGEMLNALARTTKFYCNSILLHLAVETTFSFGISAKKCCQAIEQDALNERNSSHSKY